MSITSENTFETAIIESLLKTGGYTEGNANDYSPELGMFKAEVLHFLRDSQPKQWDKLTAIHGDDVENRLIQRLYKEMDLRGALDVIRNGIVDYGVRFKIGNNNYGMYNKINMMGMINFSFFYFLPQSLPI